MVQAIQVRLGVGVLAATNLLAGASSAKQLDLVTYSKKALGTWNVSTSCASGTTELEGFGGATGPSDIV